MYSRTQRLGEWKGGSIHKSTWTETAVFESHTVVHEELVYYMWSLKTSNS